MYSTKFTAAWYSTSAAMLRFARRCAWATAGAFAASVTSPVQADDLINWIAPPDAFGNWMQTSNWSASNVTDFYEFRIDNGGGAILAGGAVHGAYGKIGDVNAGRLIQTGGRLELDPSEARGLLLGLNSGSSGQYDLVGGYALMDTIYVGLQGQGLLNVSGGELQVESHFDVGPNGQVNHAGGTVKQISPDGFGSMRVNGEYRLSGHGRLEAPSLFVQHGGTFEQSGGEFLGNIGALGSAAKPARVQLNGGLVRVGGISLDGDGSDVGAFLVQDGVNVDAGIIQINGGAYTQLKGVLTAQAMYLDSNSGMFGGGPASASISHSLKVDDVLQLRGDSAPATLQVNQSAIAAHRIYMAEGSSTSIQQQGGSVAVDLIEIWGSHELGDDVAYRQDGGMLFAERGASFAGSSVNTTEIGAHLDFAGGAGMFAFGPGAHVEFGVNAKVENAENATFRLTPDSLLIAPATLDFAELFGSFEHHNVVRYERGQVLHVGEGQSVQVGGLDTRDGFSVDGRMYRNPGFGRLSSIGQFRVGPTGDLNLGWDASVVVQNHEDAGVFGGTARLARLDVGANSSANVSFTIADGGSLHLMNTMYTGGGSQQTKIYMVDGSLTGNRIMTRGTLFQQSGGVVDVGTFSVEAGQGNVVKLSGGELRAEYMGIHSGSRFEQTGGVASTEYLLMGGSVLALGANAEFHIRRQITTTTPPATVDFQSTGGTLYLDGAFMDLQAGIPFVNGQQGHLVIDEHSLVVLPGGSSLEPYIGHISNSGIVHVLGSTLTIPADREVHGSGEIRLRGHKLDVHGKVLVDPTGGALKIEYFEVHPGAVVELGPKGEAVSGNEGHASAVTGGVLRSGLLRINAGAAGVFQQTAGDVAVNVLEIRDGARYELSGGSLALSSLSGAGTLDLADSASEIRLNPYGFLEADKVNFARTEHSSLHAAPNSLLVVPPDFDTSRFASFASDGMVQVRGEELSIPAGQTIGGMVTAIVGDVTNAGMLSPGLPEAIGKITINGDVNFLEDSSFLAEINRAGVDLDLIADSIEIQGAAELGGRLEVRLLEGREPRLGQEFRILSASEGIFGSFADLALPTISGFDFEVDVRGNSLYLTIGAASSCLIGDAVPCDGAVDLNDLNAVRNAFGNGFLDGPRIPGDTYPFDGVVDLADLNAVRNHFGDISAVPEPATVTLSLIGVGLLAAQLWRRRAS